MPEVKGSSRECQAAKVQEWLKGATLRPRSGGAAERATARPRSGAVTRGATLPPRSRGVAELCYPESEVRWGGGEELPHVRGQRLQREELPCFQG